jgi:hypothetical protein
LVGDLSNTGTQVDNRMKQACDNIDADIRSKYERIQGHHSFLGDRSGSADQSTALPYCATGSSHIFLLTQANQIS